MKTNTRGRIPGRIGLCARGWVRFAALVPLLLGALSAAQAAPVTGHPRLWVRAGDVQRLRGWATDANPLFRDGLAALACRARANMDVGTITGTTASSISLTWDPTPGATGYRINRGTAPGNETPLASVVTGTGYTDTSVSSATTYYYTVQATNRAGMSGPSSEITAGTLPRPASTPPPPGMLTMSTVSDSSISLVWTASPGATSSTTCYNIYRGAAPGTETLLASGITDTSYNDGSASCGQTYCYVVRADDSAGESGPSNEVTAATSVCSSRPPSATGLAVADTSGASVRLSWDATVGASGYTIYRGTAPSQEDYSRPVGAGSSTTFTDATVACGQTYYYAVQAVNGAGASAPSAEVRVATGSCPPQPPAAPTGLMTTGGDRGDYNDYFGFGAEMYAELFAFLSIVSNEPATRDGYAQRARAMLMVVINAAALGRADGEPYRGLRFASADGSRARYHGEAFGLVVDWIYPYLSAADKATIRQVFLRWAAELCASSYPLTLDQVALDFSPGKAKLNDPSLVSDPQRYRWAGNNYFAGHMRNLGLLAMALDPEDDPGGQLHGYLAQATGGWLYMLDYLMRHDSAGGLLPEGFEYSPQTLGYTAQLLLALRTAGEDDPAVWGPQVVLTNNPFWDAITPGLLHSLSPAPVGYPVDPQGRIPSGPLYQPAWYGDGERYWAGDPIETYGPLSLYDSIVRPGDSARLNAARWIESNVPSGGSDVIARMTSPDVNFRDALLYFLLFDPAAPTATDPRPALPLTFFAPGIGRILARTSWGPDATWFTYKLSWNSIDHQQADGNQFELYRKGEWLTQQRTGYNLDSGASQDHNTLALENDPPSDSRDFAQLEWKLGSQWINYVGGEPALLAHSFGPNYVYALGDATGLYNSTLEQSTDISHASRSIVWLEPDHVIVYDRAISKTPGRFKRFWLNLPAMATVSGSQSRMATASGQQIFVKTLLPSDAAITAEKDPPPPDGFGDEGEDGAAIGEPMKYRLEVEAPGGPQSTRFLHVLQGADAGAAPDPAALVQSTNGTPYAGTVVHGTAVLFPVDLDAPFAGLTYGVPVGTARHMVTGLAPNAGYSVASAAATGRLVVTIAAGGSARTDDGGVLAFDLGGARLVGDVNGDGKLTIADAVLALRIAVGMGGFDAAQRQAADLDGDGVVNIRDVILLIRRIIGL